MNFEVNMRRAHPVRTCGIGAGLYGFDPTDAVAVRSNADATDKVWVEWRRIEVVGVHVPAKGVGLPDRDGYPADRLAIEIEYSSRDLDDLSLRKPFDPYDGGQVVLQDRRMSGWEVGTRIWSGVRCRR